MLTNYMRSLAELRNGTLDTETCEASFLANISVTCADTTVYIVLDVYGLRQQLESAD